MAAEESESRLVPAGSSDSSAQKRFRFKLRSQRSGVNTADVRPRNQGGIAPIVAKKDDHIVLDLKDGHPCTIWTVLSLWFVFFFPYSPLFLPTIAAGLYIAYRQLSHSVWLVWAALNILFLLLPPYYNRLFREEYFRRLYITLAHYANSSRAVIPAKQYPPGKRYIFGLHPHGRVMYSTALISQLHDVFRRVLPEGGGDVFGAIAAAFFYVPFVRNWFYMLGAISAAKPSMRAQLERGNNVAIVVGGVKEVCLPTYPDKDVLYLKKRFGFIKLALETKAGLVPVYFFNENSLFKPQPLRFLKFWEAVNHYVPIGVPLFHGFWNLPFPYQRDLLMAFGEPLFAKDGETVEEFHSRYVEAVKQLFNKYVGMSADPKHKLVLV
ncbi:diacylglycerol O-acyltransferase [Klebsormidium nitens]|uniref:Acyltransferase n=1 Tax=Klebsormidium nitens TaxID=105231 RepID=A0A1Y1HZN5_KLENI|nr:diacylglycerol O-acyltransferase [Klebsormidium nitens]|eukprot:GAQ82391.1 diacylglycerol O-acyltransferase [Klebsormidium nitens]